MKSTTLDTEFRIREGATDTDVTGTIKYSYAGNTVLNTINLITVCPEWDVTEKTFAAGKHMVLEITSTSDSIQVVYAAVIES